MKTKLHQLLITALLAWPLAAAAAPDANDAKSYALRLPIRAAEGAGLQRLPLPAQALVTLQTSGYNDVRIFNAQGQAVPMALTQAQQTQTERQQIALTAYPILGGADTAAQDMVSLRIEDGQGGRVVQLDTSGKPPSITQKVVGALLDARAVAAPVVALELQADVPNAQPISFYVQASKDLKTWRPVADTVLYRVEGAALATGNRIELAGGIDVKDNYLRITWSDAAGADAKVAVKGALLSTARSTASPSRVSASIAATLSQPHELSFALPFATPIAALKIKAPGSNVLVPVRVLGRNDRSQAWVPLASTVVYNLSSAGKEQTNAALELGAAPYREIKIEADKKTPGFAAVPAISVEFEPAQLVFLASGNAPFTLAAGLASAGSAYLPVQSLMPGYQSGAENNLPAAAVAATNTPVTEGAAASAAPVVQTQITSQVPPTRNLILWAVLIGGALALAFMAWVLMKQMKKPVE
jgi:hypothetical protein